MKGLRGQPQTRPKTCALSHGEVPPGHPHLPTRPVHRGGFPLTVNGDRDVEKEMILLFLLPCISAFSRWALALGTQAPRASPLCIAGGILAGVISDRLEKRASTCGLMLLLAAPTVSPAPATPLPCPGPEPPEVATLPASKHCHIPPGLSPIHSSWFLDTGYGLRTPQRAPWACRAHSPRCLPCPLHVAGPPLPSSLAPCGGLPPCPLPSPTGSCSASRIPHLPRQH